MKIRVFFNKSCKICKYEINHYKKISKSNFSWIDIVNNKEAQNLTSKTYEQLIRKLHILKDGKVISGADAFLEIWKNIPRYRFLYKIFKNKFLFIIFNLLYEIVAYLLFLKNKHLLKK